MFVSRETDFCERRSNVPIVRIQTFELATHSNDSVSACLARDGGQRVIGQHDFAAALGHQTQIFRSQEVGKSRSWLASASRQ
jgi:hypothetical protein